MNETVVGESMGRYTINGMDSRPKFLNPSDSIASKISSI